MKHWTDLFSQPGFQSALVRRFGVSKQTVNDWRRGIPAKYVPGIEEECGGVFTRKDMRPDDWQMYWPELATPQKAEA